MANLTVHGTPVSTYVRTVRLLLEEAGADYTLQEVGIFNGDNDSAAYRAKNPFGKVPTLEADGTLIYETTAITDYLNTVVADHKFTPSEPMLKARMLQIMSIVDSYLYTPAIGTIVIQRLIVPDQGGQPDEAAVKQAIAPAKTALEAIEAIAASNPYLLGRAVTIADFYLAPIFVYLAQTPEFDAVTAATPKLRAWWTQISQRPQLKAVCG